MVLKSQNIACLFLSYIELYLLIHLLLTVANINIVYVYGTPARSINVTGKIGEHGMLEGSEEGVERAREVKSLPELLLAHTAFLV